MKVQSELGGSLPVPPSVQESKPTAKLGGWAIALIFFALLVVLILANM